MYDTMLRDSDTSDRKTEIPWKTAEKIKKYEARLPKHFL